MEAQQAHQAGTAADLTDPLRVGATCAGCKRQIKPGEYRVVVVAAEISGRKPFATGLETDLFFGHGRRTFLAFCYRCAWRNDSAGWDSSGGRHPLMRVFFGATAREIAQDVQFEEYVLRELAEAGKIDRAEKDFRERQLEIAVRQGDVQGIDAVLPPEVRRREASLDATAENYARRRNSNLPKSKQIGHNEAVGIVTDRAVADVGDDCATSLRTTTSNDGPRLMAEYLKDEVKKATLRPFLCSVAVLWAEGKNQGEIAQALRSSQPTVSRAIQALKKIIHVAL